MNVTAAAGRRRPPGPRDGTQFARDELRPVALRYDETEEYPLAELRRAAALGLTCFDLPVAFGGGGVERLTDRCAVIEELSFGDSPIVWVIAQGGFFAGPVLALGIGRAEAALSTAALRHRPTGLFRCDHRTGARLRLGRDRDACPACRRRLRDRRAQEVHRERADRRALRRLRDGRRRDRGQEGSPRSSSSAAMRAS